MALFDVIVNICGLLGEDGVPDAGGCGHPELQTEAWGTGVFGAIVLPSPHAREGGGYH